MTEKKSKIIRLVSSLIILLFLVVASILFFHGGPDDTAIRSIKDFWNLGHIAYFALLTYLLIRWRLLEHKTLYFQWLAYLLLSLVLGSLIEVIQYGTDRSADLMDISRDVTGCLLVLVFHPGMLKPPTRLKMNFIRLIVCFIFILHLIPLAIALIDETTARYQFPVLSDFGTPFERDRWNGRAPTKIIKINSVEGNHQLEIGLTTTRYSGVGLNYFPGDWRGFKAIHLRIFQPLKQALIITVRIHDLEHETGRRVFQYNDRYNRRFSLNKGWNEITIKMSDVESAPATRNMDLGRIRDISFFTHSLPKSRTIYLDTIYLSEDLQTRLGPQ